jgi:hypothetical protein
MTGYFSWTVPFVQHPPKDSFDPTADCMITESPFTVYGSINETVIVSFTRLNAIVRVVLQDKQTQGDDMAFPLAGQHVRSVVLGNDTDYEEEKEGTLLSGDIEYLFMGDGEPFLEYRGKDRVVAEYTDKTTYVIGEEGAATFFITIPCVLKQSENPLYIRVETDDYIIERSITLPADVGLQPSRMTTLNVGLFDDGVKGTKYTRKGITLLEPVWDQEAWDYHYVPMTSMTVEVGEDSEFAFKVAGIIPEVESLGEFVFGPSDSDLIRPVLEYGRYDSEKGLFRGVSVHGIRLGEELFTIELTAGSTVYTASIPVTVTLGEKGRSLEGNYGEDNEPGQGINGNKYVEEGEL